LSLSFPDDKLPPNGAERREIASIKEFFCKGGDEQRAFQLLDGQLSVLHTRAMALAQLAGVVITVTGFSGRIIADTNVLAQILIIIGVVLVVTAAAIAVGVVMPIRWISSYLHLGTDRWMLIAIRRRNRKNRAFRFAAALLILGMAFYITSISIMLLYPEATELTRVR
jgi:hypothetical protein